MEARRGRWRHLPAIQIRQFNKNEKINLRSTLTQKPNDNQEHIFREFKLVDLRIWETPRADPIREAEICFQPTGCSHKKKPNTIQQKDAGIIEIRLFNSK